MASIYRIGDEIVPGYTLLRFLGRGGFGEVWQAAAPGGTEVAVKIIPLAGRQGRKEFRALQRVKRIRHPNLVPILAYWLKGDDGRMLDNSLSTAPLLETSEAPSKGSAAAPPLAPLPKPAELVIAMGLADKSLFDRLRQCREQGMEGIPRDELLGYMEDAAEAIDFLNQPVHNLGTGPVSIQHCDVKPHNLLIVGGAVQVCDFGLARVMGAIQAATLTAGTIAYAAPECLKEGKPSPTSDQYSLAVSYVELRTGMLPYENETFAAVTSSALKGTLELARLAPTERAVVRRATNPDPAKRFRTAGEMVMALREAVIASTGPVPRSVLARALVPVAALVLAALGTWYVFPRPQAPDSAAPETAQAPLEPVPPSREETVATATPAPSALPAAAQRTVEMPRPEKVQTQAPPAAKPETVEELDRLLSKDPRNARAYYRRGMLYLEQQRYDEAIADFERLARQTDLDDAQAYASRPEYAKAYLERGTLRLQQRQLDAAIDDLTRGMLHHPDDFRLFSRRGTAWFLKQNWQDAADDFAQAVDIDPSDVDLVNLGRAQEKLGKLAEARVSLAAAAQRNPENAEAHFFLGQCARLQQDYREAAKAYGLAIETYAKLPEPVFELAQAHADRAACYLALGGAELGDAQRELARALELNERLSGADALAASLSKALAKAGRDAEAAVWARRASNPTRDHDQRANPNESCVAKAPGQPSGDLRADPITFRGTAIFRPHRAVAAVPESS